MIVHRAFKSAPAVDLEVTNTFSSNGRRRTVYRIVADGQEVGTAIEQQDHPKPWRITIAGYCGGIVRASKMEVLATVARVLTTGAIWR